MSKRSLASVAYVAPDYDAAIAFFCGALGFELIEDNDLGGGKRWVVVAPGRAGAQLVIAKAAGDAPTRGDRRGRRRPRRLFPRDRRFCARPCSAFIARGRRIPGGAAPRGLRDRGGLRRPFGVKWDLIERERSARRERRTAIADLGGGARRAAAVPAAARLGRRRRSPRAGARLSARSRREAAASLGHEPARRLAADPRCCSSCCSRSRWSIVAPILANQLVGFRPAPARLCHEAADAGGRRGAGR